MGFDVGTWAMAVGDDAGRPVLFRVRTDRPPAAGPAHRHMIAVLWQYTADNAAGMPSTADADRMDVFEDLATAALHGPGQAVLTAVVTGTGVREWQWYSRDPDETLRLVTDAVAGRDDFPVELAGEDDPEWAAHGRALAYLQQFGDGGSG